jgi:hypothetical protein
VRSLLWFTVGFGIALFVAGTAPQSKIITISDMNLVDSLKHRINDLEAESRVEKWNQRGIALQLDLFEARFRTMDSLEHANRLMFSQ